MKFKFLIAILFACVLVFSASVAVAARNFEREIDALQRFVDYGILPEVDVEYFDRYISHFGFSDILHIMTGQPLSEALLVNSGLAHMRYNDALAALYGLSARSAPTYASPAHFLTFSDLISILNNQINFFITDEFEKNLSDTPLNGIFLINQLHADAEFTLDSSLFNAHGSGDIVIVPSSNSHIFLSGINIYGNIVILPGEGYASITLHNSSANAIYVKGNAEINFVGNNHIEEIEIHAGAYINTQGLTRLAVVPNVTAFTYDLNLGGRFGQVDIRINRHFSPASVIFNGHIEYLQSTDSILILGDGIIDYYSAPALNMISYNDILNQRMEYIIAVFFEQLLEQIDYIVWWQIAQSMSQFLQASPPSTGSAPPAIFVPTPPSADPTPTPES